MKGQVKRAFESYSGHRKKKNNKIFFNPQYKCGTGASIPYLKINTPLFWCSLFFKEYLPIGQDQQNDKRT